MNDDEVLRTFDMSKGVSLDIQFNEVDPELLGLLTGGGMGAPPASTFTVEIIAPIKRTFWQWLRRKPKRYQTVVIPRTRMNQSKTHDPQ